MPPQESKRPLARTSTRNEHPTSEVGTTTSKVNAVRNLEDEHGTIAGLIGRLGPEEFAHPVTMAGVDWSARTLLGESDVVGGPPLEALVVWQRGGAGPHPTRAARSDA